MEHMIKEKGKIVRVRTCGCCSKVVSKVDMTTGMDIMKMSYAKLINDRYICMPCTEQKIRNMSGYKFIK